MDQGFWEKVKQ